MKYQKNNAFVERVVADQLFLVPIKRNKITSELIKIDGIGETIWEFIEEKDIIKIRDHLSETYPCQQGLEDDIETFILNAIEIGILEVLPYE